MEDNKKEPLDRAIELNDELAKILSMDDVNALKAQQQEEAPISRTPSLPSAPGGQEPANLNSMQSARDERDKMNMYGNLLRSFQDIISGATGAKANYAVADNLQAQGKQVVTDLEKDISAKKAAEQQALINKLKMSAEDRAKQQMDLSERQFGLRKDMAAQDMAKGDIAIQKGQMDLENAMADNDPSSENSKFLQDALIKVGPKGLDTSRLANASASQILRAFPFMKSAMQLKAAGQSDALALRRLEQADRRLDLLSGKETRLGEQFTRSQDFRESEKQQDQAAKIVDSYQKDKVVQKSNEMMSGADTAISLANSDNPIGHKSLTNFLARASGEVGALTEADKAPFGGSMAITSRIKQVMSDYATGKLTPENKAFVIDLAKTMGKTAKRNLAKRAMDLSQKYSKSYGLDRNQVMYDYMIPDMKGMPDDDKEAVEWALKNPGHKNSEKILKLHGM